MPALSPGAALAGLLVSVLLVAATAHGRLFSDAGGAAALHGGRRSGSAPWDSSSSSSRWGTSGSSSNSSTAWSSSGGSRQLQAAAYCPEGCQRAYCLQDATTAGLRCQLCQGSLVVNKLTGQCSCPAGKWSDGNSTRCLDCPRGSYCFGGVWSSDPALAPQPVACPANMTTMGLRSTSQRSCVNMPGFSYGIDVDGNISVSGCPPDTYSPGFKKQRGCVPCPTGFTTNGFSLRTSPYACLVPAGYYLKSPGQVAPCPRGEWKSGVNYNASCTKCAAGVTTKLEASISANNCTDVLAGYYAFNVSATGVVLGARACPQKFYCAGGTPAGAWTDPGNATAIPAGDATVVACPDQLWTTNVGATSPNECLTPPGFFTANGTTDQCPGGINGGWRADWAAPGEAVTCSFCGDNVYADRTDLVTVYDPVTYAATTLPVTTSADDCYIKPGQGLYYNTLANTWRTRNCGSDNYGVTNTTYGLTPTACRDCPFGMYASNDVTTSPNSAAWWLNDTDGAGGFASPLACVTRAGYGYNNRFAQLCDRGFWNPADTRTTCTACGYGLTTADVGAGVTAGDCGIALGFGAVNATNGSLVVMPCPIGTYNDQNYTAGTTTPCTPCPTGTVTQKEGADSPDLCNLCAPGYGGPACSEICGGVGDSATFGVPGRAVDSNCTRCTPIMTGYAFDFNLANDLFAPAVLSRTEASSPVDCVSQYTQINDGAWFLPLSNDNSSTVLTGVTSFRACVQACSDEDRCMFLTHDYLQQSCTLRLSSGWSMQPKSTIAFKASVSGDIAANSMSAAAARAGAKAVASGSYTWWRDDWGRNIGTLVVPAGRASFTALQQCLSACDDDTQCAGIMWPDGTPAAPPGATPAQELAAIARGCYLFYGDRTLGEFKRTMQRAHVGRMLTPTLEQWSSGSYP